MKDIPAPQLGPDHIEWYKKPWLIALVVLLSLALLGTLYFAYQVYSIAQQIEAGTITTEGFSVDTNLDVSTTRDSNRKTAGTTDDPSFGNPNAKVTIVEFGDFECPFCAQSFPDMRALQLEYKDHIHYIWRDFPLTGIHPDSQKAAEAGECAEDQGKFWELHDKMFINQNNLSVIDIKQYARQVGLDGNTFDRCLDSGRYENEVQADLADGIALGVRGTPTFFINDQLVSGVIPKESLEQVFQQLLAE